jgi:DNA modification methylase
MTDKTPPPMPYHEDGMATIHHADCETVLHDLHDIGLVFTSPPYNLGMGLDDVPVETMHDRRSRSRHGAAANRLTASYDEHDDAMLQADYIAWQRRVLHACWDTLATGGAIFYNHKPRSQAGFYRTPLDIVPPDLPVRQVIIWDRVERGQAYTQQAFVPTCEWIVVLARPTFRLKDRAASSIGDVWRVHADRDGHGHPCPFPIGLPARAINAASIVGPILDPFMGVGTTLRAAVDAGVPAIGIDRSERYCELAVNRLAQATLDFA